MTDYLTWSQWKANVLALMPQDTQRIGLMDAVTPGDGLGYIPKLIIQGVLDLQDFIQSYRKRHESLYYPDDFVSEGRASVGTLPPQANIQEAWLWHIDRSNRFAVEQVSWSDRFHLVNHSHRVPNPLGVGLNSGNPIVDLTNESFAAIAKLDQIPATGPKCRALMAVDPAAHLFYFYPEVLDGWLVSIFWDGRKCDWRESELVPFDDEEAWAVAAFCRAKIALEVDRDPVRHDSIWRDYALKRTNLYIARKENGRLYK